MWTGVKCDFSWAHLNRQYGVGKLLIGLSWIWNFTRIGCKTKKLRLSIIPAWRRSHQPPLGQPKKGVNWNFSWPHLDKRYVVGKLSISEAKICRFSRMGQKIQKNYSSLNVLYENIEKISLDWAVRCASRGIHNFSLAQLHEPYSLG